MRSLKQIFLIIMLMSTILGVAQNNYSEESVKTALKQSFVAFVNNVSPAYSKGDTYSEFKSKVLFGVVKPTNYTLPPISSQGENLLTKTYQYLAANYTSKQILNNADYKTYGRALIFINDYSKNRTLAEAEIALFGGNSQLLTNNSLLNSTRGACKWWQLWCHLNQVFGNGAGAQILNAIVTIIINLL